MKTHRPFRPCYVAICLLLFSVVSAQAAPNLPLEIFQPQPGYDANNRFSRAYPGLVYNVELAVAGGTFPYTHQLLNAPNGMTLSKYPGVINWPVPTSATGFHPIEVQVTDGNVR